MREDTFASKAPSRAPRKPIGIKTNNSQEPQCAPEWEKDEKAFVSFPFLGRIFDKGRFSVYPDLSIARIYPSTSFSAA